ncbi:MAG: hypothetical protein GX442_01850 [Candidatus Riflebacteria bacterium]|nr:hypothetical protein [Candidatus Riflebacteria bacterium]
MRRASSLAVRASRREDPWPGTLPPARPAGESTARRSRRRPADGPRPARGPRQADPDGLEGRAPWSGNRPTRVFPRATGLLTGGLLAVSGLAWAAGGTPIRAPAPAAAAPVAGQVASGAAQLLSQLPPEVTFAITTLGFGGIAGWSVGYTLKKFAKAVALVIGTVVIVLQILAYQHYLTIHWEQVQTALPADNLQSLWMGMMSIITYNFPFAGAFAVGFYMGFAKG